MFSHAFRGNCWILKFLRHPDNGHLTKALVYSSLCSWSLPGACQAQLKDFRSLFLLVVLKSLTKGLAFNPQHLCCTGNNILLLGLPGLPNWPPPWSHCLPQAHFIPVTSVISLAL